MNSSEKKSSASTSGTCTADIKHSEEEFTEFEGSSYLFYKEDLIHPEWAVSAETRANNQGNQQLITLWIPREGNVQNKTYEITQENGNASKARATWAITNPASWYPYPAISGSVTVSVDESSETLEATFHFDGKQGSKEVALSNGRIEVKGLTEDKHYRATGVVECDLSESVSTHYASTTTQLSTHPAFGSFPAYINGWSQDYAPLPTRHNYVLAIHVAQGVSAGTYPISTDSQEVRVFFIDRNDSFPCLGESGSITLNSIPDFTTLEGELSGSFNFKAVANDTPYFVKAQNGQFKIEKAEP